MLALEETGCAVTSSLSVSPADRFESDLSRPVFCEVIRDDIEPLCLTDALNEALALSRLMPLETLMNSPPWDDVTCRH